jgi:hypothetical protein
VEKNGSIRLFGVCHIDDAESLLRCLLAGGEGTTVDWRGCVEAHSAVVQILLATRPALIGPPANGFLQTHVAPLINDSMAILPTETP